MSATLSLSELNAASRLFSNTESAVALKRRLLQQLKASQKTLALEIRAKKSTRKQCQNGVVPGLDADRRQARHAHLLYCLLRGRAYTQIEQSCATPPEEYLIKRIWKTLEDAAIRELEAEACVA